MRNLSLLSWGLTITLSGPYLQAKGEDGKVHSLGGVYIGSSAPSNPLPGRWWFDDANSKLFLYDGSAWQTITGSGGGGGSTTVVGGDGIIATTSGSTATVAIDLASAANGLVISSGELKAEIALQRPASGPFKLAVACQSLALAFCPLLVVAVEKTTRLQVVL